MMMMDDAFLKNKQIKFIDQRARAANSNSKSLLPVLLPSSRTLLLPSSGGSG
jgi:hypothetical protein